MNRKEFLQIATAIQIPLFCGDFSLFDSKELNGEVRMLTSYPGNHFFGYYGINPWNEEKTQLLSLETKINDRLPKPGEEASIGLVSMSNGRFEKIATTTAWNLQQGCMLHWNPQKPNEEFYHNDIIDNQLVSVLQNINTGHKRIIPYTISGMSHDGRYALHMNYARISRLRKVVSYGGAKDLNPNSPHPANDGVFVLNLETGIRKLIISFEQIAEHISAYAPEIKNRHMWIEHAEFNKDSSRFLFLPRTWDASGKKLETGMYTIGINGEDMRQVIPYGASVSHFGWRNKTEIIATFNYCNNRRCHVLFTDGKEDYRAIGNLKWDGHCSFSDDGEWLLTDGNKDFEKNTNSVWLHHIESGEETCLATLQMLDKKFLTGNTRCDLHPRWSNNNKMICIDAMDPKTYTRQIFIINLS